MRKRIVTVLMLALAVAGLFGARLLAQGAADQAAPAEEAGQAPAADSAAEFDFFSDQPIVSDQLVELPPPKSAWITVGGPLALLAFFFVQMFFFWWMVPFQASKIEVDLHDLPTGAKRGIGMALLLFGIAFCFGASEIWYQLRLHGSAEAYFEQMSLGKLIAFTHAHLFGFTTSFFIIGIPFSLQFSHLWPYQWIFPIGLAASLTDVISWWRERTASTPATSPLAVSTWWSSHNPEIFSGGSDESPVQAASTRRDESM